MPSLLALLALLLFAGVPQQPAAAPSAAPASATGALLSPAELASLLPPTVFFRGQTAPIQLRNAAAVRFRPDDLFFAALVDSSGYSSGVQEVYQFYLVTEDRILLAGKPLPAGAYGGGYLADGTFVIMDIGGHPVLRGPVATDAALPRPRPLVLQMQSGTSARLYLGRRYVDITSPPHTGAQPVK